MVKKVKKYLKFVVCCALIMSLVAPSYAALSASDGSAFVTKAEFDSALSDFNARLTTFEAGINSKIDSQVSSYLDRNGIWNGKTQVLYSAQVLGSKDMRSDVLYVRSPEILWENPEDRIMRHDASIACYTQRVTATAFSNRWEDPHFYFHANKTGLAYVCFAHRGFASRSFIRMYNIHAKGNNNYFGLQLNAGWSFVQVNPTTKKKQNALYNWNSNELQYFNGQFIPDEFKNLKSNDWGWTGDGFTILYTGPDSSTKIWYTGQIFVTKDQIYGVERFTTAQTMMSNLYTGLDTGASAPDQKDPLQGLTLDAKSRSNSSTNGDNSCNDGIERRDVTVCIY